MCCLLASMLACLSVPCTSREWFHPWSTTTAAWIALTTGPKHATAFWTIAHLCYDVYPEGVWGWFCGLASELELARSGAVHPANSPVAGPWCQCQ